MNPTPKARGIPPLTQAETTGDAWYRLPTAISKPHFITIAAFCTIGLLTMLNLILRFPSFGAIIEQYNQF
jgi:hypothetical protein